MMTIQPKKPASASRVPRRTPELVALLPEMTFSEWLAAERDVDPARWAESVQAHRAWIDRLDELGVAVVLGTRPLVEPPDSRRNEAFVWSRNRPEPVPIHQKYYLPDEPGYWERSWYDRGPRRFDPAPAGDALVGTLICTELWFLEWARHYASEGVEILATPRATRSTLRVWG